jgi:hypothetical protein
MHLFTLFILFAILVIVICVPEFITVHDIISHAGLKIAILH